MIPLLGVVLFCSVQPVKCTVFFSWLFPLRAFEHFNYNVVMMRNFGRFGMGLYVQSILSWEETHTVRMAVSVPTSAKDCRVEGGRMVCFSKSIKCNVCRTVSVFVS